jgi:CDGSH-type Zn-finger protein
MTEPTRAADTPMFTEVEQGKSYFWCACGLSKAQPFCDGSHSTTDITPVKYVAEKTGGIAFCCCKQTGKKPVCDGSHNKR